MITFAAVTKHFGDSVPALENLSFDVKKGEFVFLTGPSGSGKSTLLKLLTKEYSPTSGEVTFDGKSLNTMRGSQVHHHRRSIGVVFQDYRLLPDLNVWENIALALEIVGKPQHEIEERVTDLLDLVQLTTKAYSFPAQLSGGEAQRIGIARASATAPEVLLADEPTGNLDPQNTVMIAKLFDKIHQIGTTIFFATHDVNVLQLLPHRRIHLEKGKLISDSGTHFAATSQGAAPSGESPLRVAEPEPAPEKSMPPLAPTLPTSEPPAELAQKRPTAKTRFALPSFPKMRFSWPFGHSTAQSASPSPPSSHSDDDLVKMIIQIEGLDDNDTKQQPKGQA